MENERLARVEEQTKRIPVIEEKLDRLIEKSELRWGKIIGAILSVNAILALIAVALWH